MNAISCSVTIGDGSLMIQELSVITPTPVTSFEFCFPLHNQDNCSSCWWKCNGI